MNNNNNNNNRNSGKAQLPGMHITPEAVFIAEKRRAVTSIPSCFNQVQKAEFCLKKKIEKEMESRVQRAVEYCDDRVVAAKQKLTTDFVTLCRNEAKNLDVRVNDVYLELATRTRKVKEGFYDTVVGRLLPVDKEALEDLLLEVVKKEEVGILVAREVGRQLAFYVGGVRIEIKKIRKNVEELKKDQVDSKKFKKKIDKLSEDLEAVCSEVYEEN